MTLETQLLNSKDTFLPKGYNPLFQIETTLLKDKTLHLKETPLFKKTQPFISYHIKFNSQYFLLNLM